MALGGDSSQSSSVIIHTDSYCEVQEKGRDGKAYATIAANKALLSRERGKGKSRARDPERDRERKREKGR